MWRPKVPAAGLAALAVVLATEAAFLARTEPLTGMPVFQPTADDATLTVKRRMLPRAAGAVVFVGDSSCTMGLRPDVFRDETGLPVVNLGTISSFTLPGFADLTAEALDRPDPPRAVVVALLPRSFGVSEADAREFGLLGRYLVATGRRTELYRVASADWRGWFARKHRLNIFPAQFGGSFAEYERVVLAGDGFLPERATYQGTPADKRLDWFEPTDYSRAGLRALFDACRAKGVPVFVWWSPVPADAVTDSYTAAAEKFARQLQADNPDVRFGRATSPVWAPERFGTVTHLNPAAAADNTRELAAWIKTLVPPIRGVVAPARTPR